MADRDFARVAEAIRTQQQVVAELTAAGRFVLATEARMVLAKFEGLQRMDAERRDRLKLELAELEMRA